MHVEIEDSLKQGLLDSNGKTQQTIFINESGLYSLILSSKLSQAKEFKRWVTSEVLPQIKKVGGYIPINGCNLVLWFYSSIFFTHTPIRIDNYSLRLIKQKQVVELTLNNIITYHPAVIWSLGHLVKMISELSKSSTIYKY